MEADWESEFLTTRHVHNRKTRHELGSNSGAANAFDVRKTFGSYDLKCPVAETYRQQNRFEEIQDKRNRRHKRAPPGPRLEIYRLTDSEDGLLGELVIPDILQATVTMAGSRKQLRELIEGRRQDEDELREDIPGEPLTSEASGDEEATSSTHLEAKEKSRFQKFEKNSFRQPKFWLHWHGGVLAPPDMVEGQSADPPGTEGMGYLVFSGNKCRDFKGTLSCDLLGWKDIKLEGWKRADMKERDVPLV
ncbi:catalase [Fusarium albosuccineum]|uniref:Catalase n=1 Tax=Fusarium albosuccineum TaxID=1237068 RepID=A0A8H4L8Q6_9HYPO|nr:catalase [Fusarium albosuccineum]